MMDVILGVPRNGLIHGVYPIPGVETGVLFSDAMTKRARIWLLLLLALLLPVKGAMAAAGVFCHLGSSQPLGAIIAHAHLGGAAADHGHHPESIGHTSHGSDDQSQPTTDSSCTYCSAICSVPPLPAAGVSVIDLLPPGAERFAALAQRHQSAVSDGLDRPPRTI